MEELIDVFLDELIDKKEISQNERTDMKLTLLEAMPNGLNDETKTRVMSTLKSKMETPSANIFTDKGVNIEAVRTIATETVKNVVETVEKETSAREEAEAKRAAKVDDALSQTIAEADEKENIIKEQENVNEKNDDDLYYEDPIYFKVSHKSMQQAYKEALKAYNKKDVPVGCVIVHNDKIIARGHNLRNDKKNVLYHAEIIAIDKACKKLHKWILDDCTLYSTMEPCIMCSGAIIQSRIKKIVYSMSNNSFGNIENNEYFKKNKYEIVKIDNNEILKLVQKFFKKLR